MKSFSFSNKTIIVTILLLVFLVWNDIIMDAYDDLFVKPFFSIIHDTSSNFFLFFIIYELTAFYFLYLISMGKKSRNEIVFITMFLLCNYIWYRFFSTRYVFAPLHNTSIKYSDYFIFFSSGILLVKAVETIQKKKEPSNPSEPFLIDKPWQAGDSDMFGRSRFARVLAERIQSKPTQLHAGSLAIGINGSWGSGKTSFLNKIKSFIDNENRIVIEFNPWRSVSAGKIIEDFFELLISELSPYAPNLSNNISKYAKQITKIDENVFSKSLQQVNDFFFEEKSQNEIYDHINDTVDKLNKQIIIFIDDLDRLDKKEIVEVLRLIRNSASFNKVVYIVSYDKEYVYEAIKDFNPRNYNLFLEKIFQFEFSLTKYDNKILRDNLKEGLKNLNQDNFNLVSNAIDKTQVRGEIITDWFIKSQRDVIRFLNSFKFEIENIKTEVLYTDFYYLQLLKLKYPIIHQALFDYKFYFFREDDGVLKFRTKEEKDWSKEFIEGWEMVKSSEQTSTIKNPELEKVLLTDFVYNSKALSELPEFEKENIVNTVKELIRLKEDDEVTKINLYKSFAYFQNFDKYFSYQLLAADLSAEEFDNARNANSSEYLKKIDQWLNDGRIDQLADRLQKIKAFKNREEWDKHLKALVQIGKYSIKIKSIYQGNYVDIINHLNYPNQNFRNLRFFSNKLEYKQYLLDFFFNAPDPYVFESNILTAALTPIVQLPLDNVEIHELLLGYFKKYCASHHEVNDHFRVLHRNAVKRKEGYRDEYEPLKGAQELFVDHFLNYLSSSDLEGFIKHVEGGTDLFRIHDEWVKTFFPEPLYENLEDYLEKSETIKKESKYYDEFMKFYDLYKANNYHPVEFVFEHLQPSLWTGGTKSNQSSE